MARKNPNTVEIKALRAIRGVGPAAIERIRNARSSGVRIDSVDEFIRIGRIRRDFREAVEAELDFAEDQADASGAVAAYPPPPSTTDLAALRPIRLANEMRLADQLNPRRLVDVRWLDDWRRQQLIDTAPPDPWIFVIGLDDPDSRTYDDWTVSLAYDALRGRREVTLDVDADGEVRLEAEGSDRPSWFSTDVEVVVRDSAYRVVAERHTVVGSSDILRVRLPEVAQDDVLIIEVAKPAVSLDDGLVLDWSVSRRRGNAPARSSSGTVDLVRENSATVEAKYPDRLDLVSVIIRSANGLPITQRIVSFEALERLIGNARPPQALGQGGRDADYRALKIDLPKARESRFPVRLRDKSVGATTNPYADHTVLATFDVLEPETLNLAWSGEERFPIMGGGSADAGQAAVLIEHYGLIGRARFDVLSPTGEALATRELSNLELRSRREALEAGVDPDPITIDVPHRKLAGDPRDFQQLPERPEKALCRLVDPSGQRTYADVQVILYLARKEDPEDADFRPWLAARSEAGGYFTIDLPEGPFTGAFAEVGVALGNETSVRVDVALEQDTIVEVVNDAFVSRTALFLPSRILLVVASDGDGDKACDDCAGRFDRARAVLDEFSYYSVVRTTEPSIASTTLLEDGDVAVTAIAAAVPELAGVIDELPESYKGSRVDRGILLEHTNKRKGLTPDLLKQAIEESRAATLRSAITPRRRVRAGGREALGNDRAIDWDDEPTLYQATSLAHGHLLQFKQEWISDGYSLGDIVYSLPLAPGQQKQLVVIDWEQRAAARRREEIGYQESLVNELSRDRDVNEIARGVLTQSVSGGSDAFTGSVGGSGALSFVGKGISGLLGIGGGASWSNASADQKSSRRNTLSSAQSLRDRTLQSAAAARSQRSTVIETASQGEQFSVSTETVANYNHCHALTMQYFEVLRHFRIETRLASVQECLFVPLTMTPFDFEKALRWREALERAVPNTRLRRGFAAMERIEADYEGSNLPARRFADEALNWLSGDLQLRLDIPTPSALLGSRDKKWVIATILPWRAWNPAIRTYADELHEADSTGMDRIFQTVVAPVIADAVIDSLRFELELHSGGTVPLPADATMVGRYRSGAVRTVSVSLNRDIGAVRRADVRAVIVRVDGSRRIERLKETTQQLYDRIHGAEEQRLDQLEVESTSFLNLLPENTNAYVMSGSFRYRTDHLSGSLFRTGRIRDDLLRRGSLGSSSALEASTTFEAESDPVRIATPLSSSEMRRPRDEDRELSDALRQHLNDNMEAYHQAIWRDMDPGRRFMFLDGIRVVDWSQDADLYPDGVVRSVASVVENEVIGVVGNSLVMPVAPGFRLDPGVRGRSFDLYSFYKPDTPLDPIRVSLPTKGVFAEAVMGACNSCEKIEEDRFWRWSQEPIPQSPTSILPVSTDNRAGASPDLSAGPLAQPVLKIQDTPSAPAPAGLTALATLLGKPDLFGDVTGLEQTQKNVLTALQASLGAAGASETQAVGILSKQLGMIEQAKKQGLLEEEDAKTETKKAFAAATDAVSKAAARAAAAGNAASLPSVTAGSLLDSISGATSAKVRASSGAEEIEIEVDKGLSGPGSGSETGKVLTDIGWPGTGWEGKFSGPSSTLSVTVDHNTNPHPKVADAIAAVTAAFPAAAGPPAANAGTRLWKNLDPGTVGANVIDMLKRPGRVEQKQLNACGPAAFFRVWSERDPIAVANFAIDLFKTGNSSIGAGVDAVEVKPSNDLMGQNYNDIVSEFARPPKLPPSDVLPNQGQWMLLSSLRDASNVFVDFEGTPADSFSGITMPSDLVSWLKATGTYAAVEDETNIWSQKDTNDLVSLSVPASDAFLYCTSMLVNDLNYDQLLVPSPIPRHVVLLKDVKGTAAAPDVDIWSWGYRYKGVLKPRIANKTYWGAVIAKP